MKVKTEAKRQAIIEVAAEVFREVGFERASMSEICARVGGSKATIYNYFASKDELFTEVMLQATQAEFEAVHRSLANSVGETDQALREFGEKFLSFVYSPEIQANRHMAISQSRRTEIGHLIHERGVLPSQTLIAEFLEDAMKAGKLRRADARVAARHLTSLLESELLDRFLFHLPGEITAKEIKGSTARAVEVFMGGYAAANK
jgi:AcrR family transcriptional regulator